MSVKKILNGAGKLFMGDVNPKKVDDSPFYLFMNKKFNTATSLGVVGAYTAYNTGETVLASRHKAIMGEMSAGTLSHMTSNVKSPLMQSLQDGAYNSGRVQHSMANHGAEGNIVFALHNMR